MHRVTVIGDKDSILAFKALGVEVYTVIDGEEAAEKIDELAKEDVGVIFITEKFAQEIPSTIDKYRDQMTPTIILIPGNTGSLGIGLADINKSVEKAVGANILN